MTLYDSDSARWTAVRTRDPRADNAFVYCVKTTQIYCRPTCKARLARLSNVVFHSNAQAAGKAGFRPCKRCRPEIARHDPHADIVWRACQSISEAALSGTGTRLADLATDAKLTESHFHRVFKGVMGITPRQYARFVAVDTSGSEGASSGLQTPARFDTEAITDIMIAEENLLETTAEIEFTVQPWSTFYVAIAVTGETVCAIETGDTYAELVVETQSRFPGCGMNLSDWTCDRPPLTDCHRLFQSVMDALERPCGRMLSMSPSAFESIYHDVSITT